MDKVKIVCRALIIGDSGRLLLVKNAGRDFWCLPGGKVEPEDETVEDGLVREIREELGMEATIKGIRFTQELHKDGDRYVELIFDTILSGDPAKNQERIAEISGGELSDIKWMGEEERQKENIKPEFLKEIQPV